MTTYTNRVYDDSAAAFVRWDTSTPDSSGGSYPGPGTWGVNTFDYCVERVTGDTGATTFLALTDTPSNYTSDADKILVVGNAETAVEFRSKTHIIEADTIAVALNGVFIGTSDPGNWPTLTGTHNVAIGENAGGALTTGSHNVSIGTNSNDILTTGSRNIAIGSESDQTANNQNDMIVIGNFSAGNAGQRIVVNPNVQDIIIGGGGAGNWPAVTSTGLNIIIGDSAAPSLNASATGNILLGTSVANAGTTLAANTIIGTGGAVAITTGISNTLVGTSVATSLTTGTYNLILGGGGASSLVTGSRNIVLGYNADIQSDASNQIYIGTEAGFGAGQFISLDPDTSNILIGMRVPGALGTATNVGNIYIGDEVAKTSSVNNYQTIIGHRAGQVFDEDSFNDVYLGSETDLSLAASGVLTSTGTNVSNNDTVVINGKTYTFQTVLTDSDGNVLIGAAATDSIDNLIAAINLNAGAGTLYAASTTINPDVLAFKQGTLQLVAIAKTRGTGGNAITTTETAAELSWTAGTLAGGVTTSNGTANIIFVGSRAFAHLGQGLIVSPDDHLVILGHGVNEYPSKTVAGNWPTITGQHNTLIGGEAGDALTIGEKNVIIGSLAGTELTEADENVAIGYNAFSTAAGTGEGNEIQNVAVGAQALATANGIIRCVAVGHSAMTSATTGNDIK